ncbi:MAG: hypothetical protein K2X34_01125, partial [Hyphomonadaceae bacterium]|nr:hypothetical protein [Hyphomonadaceae bacterium]
LLMTLLIAGCSTQPTAPVLVTPARPPVPDTLQRSCLGDALPPATRDELLAILDAARGSIEERAQRWAARDLAHLGPLRACDARRAGAVELAR